MFAKKRKLFFHSTSKQETPSVEHIARTQKPIKKFSLRTGIDLNMVYLQKDGIQLADVTENFVQTSTEEYSIYPSYSYSAAGYTWKTGWKCSDIKTEY